MISNAAIFHIFSAVLLIGLIVWCGRLLALFEYLRKCLKNEVIADHPERFLRRICVALNIYLEIEENAANKIPKNVTRILARRFVSLIFTLGVRKIFVTASEGRIALRLEAVPSQENLMIEPLPYLGEIIVVEIAK